MVSIAVTTNFDWDTEQTCSGPQGVCEPDEPTMGAYGHCTHWYGGCGAGCCQCGAVAWIVFVGCGDP